MLKKILSLVLICMLVTSGAIFTYADSKDSGQDNIVKSRAEELQKQIQLDTKSEIMNSKTYVPIRLIWETFGLEVKWESETETITLD